jgi:lysozyme
MTIKIPPSAIAVAAPFIKRWEGLRLKRYPDGKQYSIGHGSNADHLTDDDTITEIVASQMLGVHLAKIAADVAPLLKVKLNANQGAAVISFCYNLGVANFKKSSMLKSLNANDMQAVRPQLMRWVRAGGKVLEGLKRRRAAEADLFETAP